MLGRVPADESRESNQQQYDNGQQDESGPVQENSAFPVVFDLVEPRHGAAGNVVAPMPVLNRRHRMYFFLGSVF